MAFGAQQDMQTAIAEPTLLGRQLSQATPKLFVPRTPGTVANGLPIGPYQATRPALAHLVSLDEMSDSLALGGGRHHFFDSKSLSAAASSMASARSRFSFAF